MRRFVLFIASLLIYGCGAPAVKDTVADKKGKKKVGLPLKPERKVEFSTNEATWMSLDVSPDGKTIIFELLGDLYTLPVGGGKAERITSGMAFDEAPRYSPDGKKIVFISDRSGSDNLWILDVGSSIDDKTEARKENGLKQLTRGDFKVYTSPEWTPDGKYIVVGKGKKLRGYHLQLIHVDGGGGIDLLSKEEKIWAMSPTVDASGRYIYFSRSARYWGYNLEEMLYQVSVYDRDTGEIIDRINEPGGSSRPRVSPDGRWLAYVSRHFNKTGFRLMDLRDGTVKWLSYPVTRDEQESVASRDHYPGYAFLPDSSALVASVDGKIYKIAIPGGEREEIPFEAEVSIGLGPLSHFESRVDDSEMLRARQIRWPRLSPDKSMLAFNVLDKIYIRNLEDGKMRGVVKSDLPQYMPSWSHDGRWLAFATWNDETGGDIYKVRAEDPGTLERLTESGAYYEDIAWHPDGEFLYALRSQRRSAVEGDGPLGRRLVRVRTDGTGEEEVIQFSGHSLHFRPDGMRIYYTKGGTLESIALDGSDKKEHLVVKVSTPEYYFSSPIDAREIFISPDGEEALVSLFEMVYKVTLPRTGKMPLTLTISGGKSSFPVKKLHKIGGMYAGFSFDGSEAYWSLGSTLFRYNFDDAKKFEEKKKAGRKDGEEGDEEEAGEKDEDDEEQEQEDNEQDVPEEKREEKEGRGKNKGYTAERIDIEIKLPRYKAHGEIILRGATILTMGSGREVIENGAVLIKDNRVIKVGKSDEMPTPEGAEEIDVSGRFIVPGFIDTHAHPRGSGDGYRDVLWSYLANLAYGVTTTRNPQVSNTVLTMSDFVETGRMIGPRIFSTNRGIFAADNIQSLEDARNVMKRYSKFYKTNTIKMYISGDRKRRQWIVMAAKEQGISPTTEGALDMKMDLTMMLDGYSGQEHAIPVSPLYKDVLELVAQSGLHYTPTLLVSYGGPWAENYFYNKYDIHDDPKMRRFTPHDIIDSASRRRQWFHHDDYVFSLHAQQCKKIVEKGGRVCIGSHGQRDGIGYHWELWAVQSGGMDNMDVLRCATIFGAEAIGYGRDLGSIEEGKLADILVLDKNPLDDIRNTNTLKYVMKNGILYDADTLDEIWPVKRKLPKMYWWDDGPEKD